MRSEWKRSICYDYWFPSHPLETIEWPPLQATPGYYEPRKSTFGLLLAFLTLSMALLLP